MNILQFNYNEPNHTNFNIIIFYILSIVLFILTMFFSYIYIYIYE